MFEEYSIRGEKRLEVMTGRYSTPKFRKQEKDSWPGSGRPPCLSVLGGCRPWGSPASMHARLYSWGWRRGLMQLRMVYLLEVSDRLDLPSCDDGKGKIFLLN